MKKIKTYWISKDDDICRGKLDPQKFWSDARAKFKYTGEDVNFVNFWIKHFHKIQKSHDLALELSKDFQLGLLTNSYPEVIQKIMHTELIPQIKWDHVIESCDYGFVKPERESYLM